MPVQIINCEQNSPEWFAARRGIPTASNFSAIIAKGKGGAPSAMRAGYLNKIALEIITGRTAPSFSNGHTERGHRLEDEARQLYAFMKNVDPERVGFVRNGNMGSSPDSLVGTNRGLEIKTALPHIQMDRLTAKVLPSEHVAQVQGNMLVTERDHWDFMSFPAPYEPEDTAPVGLPPFVISVRRDDKYIAALKDAIDEFNDDLAKLVDKIRAFGTDPVSVAA